LAAKASTRIAGPIRRSGMVMAKILDYYLYDV
jgi:hypothetical protein